MGDIAELVERQNSIIQIQSGVIESLFMLLLQHISVKEADKLPEVQKINIAAQLRSELAERMDK